MSDVQIDPVAMQQQAARLGVPDLTGGQLPIGLGPDGPGVAPGTTVDLNTGNAPAFAPPKLISQALPSAPMTAPVPTATPQSQESFAPAGPQSVQTVDQHTQYQSGKKLDPAQLALQAEGRAEQAQSVEKSAELEAERDRKVAEEEHRRARDLAVQEEARKKIAEQNRLAVEAQLASYRKAQTELDSIADPKETVGTKVGNAIALALSGFGRALGGTSTVEQVIENNRAQRMNAWKAQYSRTQGKVAGEGNIYAQLRQRGLDDEAASAAATQHLNAGYDQTIRAIAATSKAPLTTESAKRALGSLKESDAQADQAMKMAAQGTTTSVTDKKSVTKLGGDTKEQNDLIDAAQKNEDIKSHRESRRALDQFRALVSSGADGAAIANFIAGKGGLGQGSFGPSMVDMVDKLGFAGKTVEQLRSTFQDGVRPELLKKIGDSLAVQTATAQQRAGKVMNHYKTAFRRAGIDPSIVSGGDTSDEAASLAGAAPSAYQGKR